MPNASIVYRSYRFKPGLKITKEDVELVKEYNLLLASPPDAFLVNNHEETNIYYNRLFKIEKLIEDKIMLIGR